jgi:hypothetical protein
VLYDSLKLRLNKTEVQFGTRGGLRTKQPKKWQTKQNREQCVYRPLSSVVQFVSSAPSLSPPPLSLSSVAIKAASLSLAQPVTQPRCPALSLRHLSFAALSLWRSSIFIREWSSRFYLKNWLVYSDDGREIDYFIFVTDE